VSQGPPGLARKQRGTLIVALMAGIAIMLILSAAAVQSWADISRRDNEAEMMFRAQDLVRALKRFQTDKGKLPTELKELTEPGSKGQFFLRQLWKDPLVKGGKWQLVYLNPAGGLYDPTAPVVPPTGEGAQPGLTQTPSLLNPPDAGAFPGSGKPGDGSADPTGLPIAGVKTRCKDRPFRRYKDKSEYSEWVFSIFDLDPRGAAPAQTGQPNPSKPPGVGEVSFPPTK
jgi:type II secretory pathway pseudopilin PulG